MSVCKLKAPQRPDIASEHITKVVMEFDSTIKALQPFRCLRCMCIVKHSHEIHDDWCCKDRYDKRLPRPALNIQPNALVLSETETIYRERQT